MSWTLALVLVLLVFGQRQQNDIVNLAPMSFQCFEGVIDGATNFALDVVYMYSLEATAWPSVSLVFL